MKPAAALVFAILATLPVAGFAAGGREMHWDPGAEECSPAQARIEAQKIDERTIVLRQNPCVDFEANLLYLLVGSRQALLIDSGAVEGELAETTAATVARHLAEAGGGAPLPLTIMHTHGHADHRAGDAALVKLLNAQIAPGTGGALRAHLRLPDWPNGIAHIDLGDRVIDVIPTPGHHEDHIALYDARTRILFTGDFLLPGRLLVDDLDAYRASAQRVAEFARTHPITAVLGGHVELDARGEAYPHGATFHPDECSMALTAADVAALPAALADFNGFYSRHPNFIIVNPIHNLLALATGVLLALALLVWGARRWWKRRRAPSVS